MFKITEPSDQDVAKFISSQRDLEFTYQEVGATNATPPAGFKVDHNRVLTRSRRSNLQARGGGVEAVATV